MKKILLITLGGLGLPAALVGQGLRQVPQRFAYVDAVGLALGIGTVGVEFATSRSTTLEVRGVGVYSQRDGVKIYGGGPGIGIRKYFGQAEIGGMVLGARVDGVWLEADNSDALHQHLSTGFFEDRQNSVYLGLGGMLGYRFLGTSGWFFEPTISYEYFVGPRPLVPGSQDLQDGLGFAVGLAFGFAW
jgi:hypothetical protein